MYPAMNVWCYILDDDVGEGRGSPSLKQLNNHVTEAVAVKWRDLGFQLLNSDSAQNVLDIIEANHKQVNLAISKIIAV